ncbi:prohibitin, putative [Ichthyophthirius multifiliis]|uniref:Prohibitin n=1 Tax=Ichthyophthirius multifiliis TaxID=5932 RepID=G0QWK0_ICHMU|nr:prohibitin, putative [Ichthyophthirius multifiliis]EGR30413.1 prohibitin, putative [Ichthyophthirius multifiliis]|eukprot:XP_004032000.1 prohibitin, putative [Ichthyophthirius multifiliis]
MAAPLVTLGTLGILGLTALSNCVFTVEPGHTALIFSRLQGLKSLQYSEGWHFRIPYFERPILFNTQTRFKSFQANTANKDMQNINLTIRVLFEPQQSKLPELYRYVGTDYDEVVFPSIVNEIMRAVVAQYSASQLMSQRDKVSEKIRKTLEDRAKLFHINIKNIAITELSFSKEYQEATEAKKIAQQEAERAKYMVEKAKDEKKSIIIKAQAQAKSIELVGKAAANDPAYLDVKRIEFAKEISGVLADSRNHIMLSSDILQMDAFKTSSGYQFNIEKGK